VSADLTAQVERRVPSPLELLDRVEKFTPHPVGLDGQLVA